jgi:hypothetical protein
MENIFTDVRGKFSNRKFTVDEIDAEYSKLFIPAPNPRDEFDGTYRPHPIAAEILAVAHGAEFELFRHHSEFDQIEILNALIIDAGIFETDRLTRIIKFHDSDYAYIHHLIGNGFHEILLQI